MGKQVLGTFGPGKPLTIPRTHLRSWWPEGSVCSQVTHWPPWPSRVAIGLRVCRFQMCTSPLWALLRQVWVVPSTLWPPKTHGRSHSGWETKSWELRLRHQFWGDLKVKAPSLPLTA